MQAAVTVPEIQAPDLHRLIRRSRGEQRAVVGNIHGHYGQLVAVQREEELQGIVVEHLHRAIQDGDWKKQIKNMENGEWSLVEPG